MALLFDDSEKLKEAVGKEAAEVIAHILEKQEEKYKNELATRSDLMMVKADLQKEMQTMKADLVKWMAGLLIVQAASIAALVKLMG